MSDLHHRLSLACASDAVAGRDALVAGVDSAEIDEQIHMLRNSRIGGGLSENSELDKAGTDLWNLCTRLRRQDGSEYSQRSKANILRSRVLAFFALDLARWSETQAECSDAAHLLKTALRTSKSCLGKSCRPECRRVEPLMMPLDMDDRSGRVQAERDGPPQCIRVQRTPIATLQYGLAPGCGSPRVQASAD